MSETALVLAGVPRERGSRSSSARRLLRRPSAALAATVVGTFIVVALGAARLAPYDPIATNFAAVR